MTAKYLDYARSKFRFLVDNHGFEEGYSWGTAIEYLTYSFPDGEDHLGMRVGMSFGFEGTPTLAFQAYRGKKAVGRCFSVTEYRTNVTIPLIEQFQAITHKKTLDKRNQMWRGGDFDEIFNGFIDEFAKVIEENIEKIKQGEVQEIVEQMKPKKKPRKKKA